MGSTAGPQFGFMQGIRGPAAPAKREVSKDELDELQYAFETLDSEKTGFVTPKQVKVRPGENGGGSCLILLLLGDRVAP